MESVSQSVSQSSGFHLPSTTVPLSTTQTRYQNFKYIIHTTNVRLLCVHVCVTQTFIIWQQLQATEQATNLILLDLFKRSFWVSRT
jgi:hypothetical protein